MGFIVLHMNWAAATRGKKIIYNITEVAAVRLDDKLHTTDTFQFVEESCGGHGRAEKYLIGEYKVLLADLATGWSSFRKWQGKDEHLVVWQQNTNKVFNWADWYARVQQTRAIKRTPIYLQELYASMSKNPYKNFSEVMGEQRLSFDLERSQETLYVVQCMVRLFRKVCKAGNSVKGDKFLNALKNGNCIQVPIQTFFPKLREEEDRLRKERFLALFRENGMKAHISENILTVCTDLATWTYALEAGNRIITYRTHKFFPGERMTEIPKTYPPQMTIGQAIASTIRSEEYDLSPGVGNEEISGLLDIICRKM